MLDESLRAVLEGQGCLVLINGEAGIGKTTLVRWLVEKARHHEVQVVEGVCYDLSLAPPYGPWLEAFADIDRDANQTGLWNPLTSGSDANVSHSHPDLFEHMRAFLMSLSRSRPLVLAIEDLQWADPASLELLRYLARGVSSIPLMIVVTYRTDQLESSRPLFPLLPHLIREAEPERISLGPFSDDDVRAFVRQSVRLELSEEDRLIAYLQSRAEGNPFYISELLRSMTFERVLRFDLDRWTLGDLDQTPIPALVRQVIEGRLARLDDDALYMLEVASVIGQIVPVDLWRFVSDRDVQALSRTLEQAIGAYLMSQLVSSNNVGFTHALVRETIYQRQIVTARRMMHRRIAEALISWRGLRTGAVAFHLEQAGDPRAVDWLIRTGERSLALHAPHDAVVAVNRAQEVASRSSRELPLTAICARASAYTKIGSFDQARRDYETILERSRVIGDERLEWQTLLDLGMLWSERDYERTGVYYQAALDRATATGDEPMIAYSLNRVANWHVNLDEADVALSAHRKALSIFGTCAEADGLADTLDLLGLASFASCDFESSVTYYERAVSRFRVLKDPQRLSSSLASIPLNGGSLDCDVALPVYRESAFWTEAGREALSLAREIGWISGEAYALIVLSMNAGVRGELGRALRDVQEGLSISERIGHRQWMIFGRSVLGRLWLELFDHRRAVIELEQALTAARVSGSRFWATNVAAVLAQVRTAAGDLDHAAAVLDWVVKPARPLVTIGQRQCWLARAELTLAQGDALHALGIIDKLIETAPNTSTERGVPQLLKARGDALVHLLRYDEAETAYLSARDKAAFFRFRPLLWRVDAARGALYRSVGRTDDAIAAFQRARAIISELGATIDDESIRETFLTRSTEFVPSEHLDDGRQTGVRGLSARELEVLRHIVEGKTDREIGDALCISPRTVMRHVTSILNKLDVSSRTAAATVAIRRNIV